MERPFVNKIADYYQTQSVFLSQERMWTWKLLHLLLRVIAVWEMAVLVTHLLAVVHYPRTADQTMENVVIAVTVKSLDTAL